MYAGSVHCRCTYVAVWYHLCHFSSITKRAPSYLSLTTDDDDSAAVKSAHTEGMMRREKNPSFAWPRPTAVANFPEKHVPTWTNNHRGVSPTTATVPRPTSDRQKCCTNSAENVLFDRPSIVRPSESGGKLTSGKGVQTPFFSNLNLLLVEPHRQDLRSHSGGSGQTHPEKWVEIALGGRLAGMVGGEVDFSFLCFDRLFGWDHSVRSAEGWALVCCVGHNNNWRVVFLENCGRLAASDNRITGGVSNAHGFVRLWAITKRNQSGVVNWPLVGL